MQERKGGKAGGRLLSEDAHLECAGDDKEPHESPPAKSLGRCSPPLLCCGCVGGT